MRQLDQAFAASDLTRTAHWRSWFTDSVYHRLQATVEECGRQGIRIAELEAELGAMQPRPYTRVVQNRLSRCLQPAVRRRIHEHNKVAPESRLRAKLEKWSLPL